LSASKIPKAARGDRLMSGGGTPGGNARGGDEKAVLELKRQLAQVCVRVSKGEGESESRGLNAEG
jgi:hypothetical protein